MHYNVKDKLPSVTGKTIKNMNDSKEFIKKIKSLTPTKDQIGMNNPAYAFGWVDAVNAIAKLVTDEVSSDVSVSVCPKCEYKLHSSGQCVNQFCSGWSRNTER